MLPGPRGFVFFVLNWQKNEYFQDNENMVFFVAPLYLLESSRLPSVVLCLQGLSLLHRASLGLHPGAESVEGLAQISGPAQLWEAVFRVQVKFSKVGRKLFHSRNFVISLSNTKQTV